MSKRTLLCGTVLALILAGVSRPAGAEWFFDLYGGGAFTQDADITIRDGTRLKATLKFDTEATGGGRVGYYLTGLGLPWLWFAVDGSYYAPATSASDVDARLEVAPISALAFLRLRLMTDPEAPTGRLQLYIGGGPSLVVTRVKLDAPVIGKRFSETTAELGARPPRGAHVHADPHLRGLRGGATSSSARIPALTASASTSTSRRSRPSVA